MEANIWNAPLNRRSAFFNSARRKRRRNGAHGTRARASLCATIMQTTVFSLPFFSVFFGGGILCVRVFILFSPSFGGGGGGGRAG